MAFCTGCGNEVTDPAHCPICNLGRAGKRPVEQPAVDPAKTSGTSCPRCSTALGEQDWEGTAALTCSNCRGTFFPSRGLEAVLNKLRASCDPVDVESVLKEFKGRFTRELPEAVRYKTCPVCETVMTRRNYANVSGVIVDFCGEHGTWVDEQAFAALADFICRGGDALARQADRVRDRNDSSRLLDSVFRRE